MNEPVQVYERLHSLLEIRELLGPAYGSEDLCLLLYSLVRMEKPENIVELGTGLGVCTLWMAQATLENGAGRVSSIDDGRDHHHSIHKHVTRLKENSARWKNLGEPHSYFEYLEAITRISGLEDHTLFYQASLDFRQESPLAPEKYGFLRSGIDLLFSDIAHGPQAIMDILACFLPYMSESCSIFIDSASTHLPSFLMLENLIDQLNRSKVPQRFLSFTSKQQRWELFQLVSQRRFRLVHLIERKARPQNSTAWIKVEPNDWVPYPVSNLH